MRIRNGRPATTTSEGHEIQLDESGGCFRPPTARTITHKSSCRLPWQERRRVRQAPALVGVGHISKRDVGIVREEVEEVPAGEQADGGDHEQQDSHAA